MLSVVLQQRIHLTLLIDVIHIIVQLLDLHIIELPLGVCIIFPLVINNSITLCWGRLLNIQTKYVTSTINLPVSLNNYIVQTTYNKYSVTGSGVHTVCVTATNTTSFNVTTDYSADVASGMKGDIWYLVIGY